MDSDQLWKLSELKRIEWKSYATLIIFDIALLPIKGKANYESF